jgi:hypothetical protein
MGQSGVSGFKYRYKNLIEIRFRMGHTGFVTKAVETIINSIRGYI